MQKIMMVIGQLGFGGAERQLLYILQNLDRQKFEPLLCVLNPGEMIPEFRSIDVPIVNLKKYLPRYDIFRLLSLIALTRRWRPDLIHSVLGNAFAFIASRINRVPHLVAERNAEPPNGEEKNLFQKWMERLVFTKSEAIVANSQAGAAVAQRIKGAKPEKIYVVPNGIDSKAFDNLRGSQAMRRELGLSPEEFTIGIIGSIVGKRKDHETFLRAMQCLSQRTCHKFQIVCVGHGPKLEETLLLAGKLGLGERILFTGVRADVPEILAALDLVVSSSQWEGMPNVIMEAMAAGKPVVATAVGGTPELVIPGETGWLVPPQDPEALALASQKMLEKPDLALEMGKAGRRRIEAFFSIEKMVRGTENIYQRLLS
jgi:glycosyltransferase involved in cell wall biosynthesis